MEQMNKSVVKGKVNIQTIMVSLTIIYCVLFPADKINVKEILLCLTIFTCLPYIVEKLKKPEGILLMLFGILYPFFTIILSVTVGESSLGSALSYGYVWIYLLLIPAIVDLNINIKKPFIIATTLVALMINFIYLSDLLGVISIYNNPLIRFFSNLNEMQWGKGELATFGYSIFFKSSPLIIYTLGYTIYNKRYVWSGVLFLSLMASGTRANLLVGIMLVIIIPLICSKEKPTKKMLFGIVLLCAAIYVTPLLIERFTALNALKNERSDSIKISAVNAIFDFMNDSPYRYIFGSGVGSYFYFPARHAYVNLVETSFFDYFRQVGIVGFSLFISFIIRPVKWLYSNQRWLLICYLGYLAIAFTNPLLVTSTSFMAYIIILSNGMGEKRFSLL